MVWRHRPSLIFAATAASVLIALAGCGSSSTKSETASGKGEGTGAGSTPATATAPVQTTPSGEATAGKNVAIEADPTGALKYTKSSITVKAGSVVIAFTNKSPLEHNLTVESASGQKLGATPTFTNATHTLTLTNLVPGTYTFFCTVPGHRAAGMHGTLVVRS